MEYRKIDRDDYSTYEAIADEICFEVCDWSNKNMLEIIYYDIINYFSETYNIEYVFYNGEENHIKAILKRYNLPINVSAFKKVDEVFANKVDGFTIPSSKKNIIMLNGNFNSFPRIIFTILHELAHIYQSVTDKNYLKSFALISSHDITQDYPEEMLPFEDAANAIASSLYINTAALVRCIDHLETFDDIMYKYKISKPALHNRLVNYLYEYLGMNESYAVTCVFKFRNNTPDGTKFVREAIFNRHI